MIPAPIAPLLSHIWQSTLFAAIAALLALALRRNQARVRYWLWLAASYKFLVPFSLLVSIGGLFQWRTAPAVVPHAVATVTDFVSDPIFLTTGSAVKPAPDHAAVLILALWMVWACGFIFVLARWVREWMRIGAIVRAASPLPVGLSPEFWHAHCHPERSEGSAVRKETLAYSGSLASANCAETQNDSKTEWATRQQTIRVVSTTERMEPGVFGILSPVLLLPEGIASRLTSDQLNSVLGHELCHVRRRDNLTAAIHMLVEALFWFYPVVWWLGARIIDERERACDEEVLRTGSQARAYAESILKVCEFYLESPLSCVSGISGSDLKKRIQRIMNEHFGIALSRRKKLLLATASIIALVGPVAVGALMAQSGQPKAILDWQGQAGKKMAFEVASVKRDTATPSPQTVHASVPLGPGDYYKPTGGLFSATNIPLFTYITFAYKATAAEIQNLQAQAPKWARSDRFDIEARGAGNPTKDQMRLMMQSLLADRFKLAIHTETRDLPVFALVLAKPGKLGPQLQAHPSNASCSSVLSFGSGAAPGPLATVDGGFPVTCGGVQGLQSSHPGRIRVGARNVPMTMIASSFSVTQLTGLDRPVLDRTGLHGMFDFVAEFTPQNGAFPPDAKFEPDPDGPSFLEAIREQLGLKLEAAKGPVDVLVIDHIEQPTPN